MRPILKWTGGKSRYAAEIVKHLKPEDGESWTICEPFAGSLAVGIEAHKQGASKVWASDQNHRLIAFYQALRRNDRPVQRLVKMVCRYEHTQQNYNELRRRINAGEADPLEFYLLNRACFRGLYRENKSGAINTPKGEKVSLPKEWRCELSEFRSFLFNARCCPIQMDAESMIRSFMPSELNEAWPDCENPNAVIYCDPPYLQTFTGYTAKGWQASDLERIANSLHFLVCEGLISKAAISEGEAAREVLPDRWRQVKIGERVNSISAGKKHSRSAEYLYICEGGL